MNKVKLKSGKSISMDDTFNLFNRIERQHQKIPYEFKLFKPTKLTKLDNKRITDRERIEKVLIQIIELQKIKLWIPKVEASFSNNKELKEDIEVHPYMDVSKEGNFLMIKDLPHLCMLFYNYAKENK